MSWRDKEPTERQMAGVKLIEKELGIKANPTTRGEASDLLDKHLAAARRALRDSMLDGWDALDSTWKAAEV